MIFRENEKPNDLLMGLSLLQHRGQESCGIAVSDTKGPKGKVLSHKGMGLVNEVFDSESMEKLAGDIGVGHVRYSTAGEVHWRPAAVAPNYIMGRHAKMLMLSNGNLINAPSCGDETGEGRWCDFQTTIDSVWSPNIPRMEVHTLSSSVGGRRSDEEATCVFLVVACHRGS